MTDIESRVAELVDEFRQIGASQMRDLPIYNPALDVEAVDFQPLGELWAGVLITPWFMSVMLLPPAKAPFDAALIGRKSQETLPAGNFGFVYGGVDVSGAYKSLPLHSPMGAFKDQLSARLEARSRLIGLLTAPAEVTKSPPAAEDSAPQTPSDLSRRAFLFGRGPSSG